MNGTKSLSNEKRQEAVLQSKVEEQEDRIESLGRQVSALVAKEADLLQERKVMARELDRITLERDRLSKTCRMEKTYEPVPLQDLESHIERVKLRSRRQDVDNF